MPRTLINNKNIKSSAVRTYAVRESHNNTMKREIVFPMIVGIICGVLIMVFWQFTARLNAQNVRLAQLEQVTSQNAQGVNEIVSFINNATKGANGQQGGAAATPDTQTNK